MSQKDNLLIQELIICFDHFCESKTNNKNIVHNNKTCHFPDDFNNELYSSLEFSGGNKGVKVQ